RMMGFASGDLLDRQLVFAPTVVLAADGTPCPEAERPVLHTLRTGEPCRDWYIALQTDERGLRTFSVNTRVVDVDDNGAPSLVVASFSDETAAMETQRELERRLALEHAMADISHDFLGALDDIDGAVARALASIGALAGASHAILAALT